MNTFLMAVQSSSISMSLSIYTMYGPKQKQTDMLSEQERKKDNFFKQSLDKRCCLMFNDLAW